ncbi:MAG TPA: Uma2 family endonuclease [Chloroflexia bacterium]|nr:Uma2 family endonuclease [Chloroflexia bacterium]
MALQTQTITAADLERMPDDGARYELVRGELRKMAPAGHNHGRIAMNLAGPLFHYVKLHNLGIVFAAETGFLLGRQPDTVRAPDVAFIGRERAAAIRMEDGFWPGAPDLAVEVISPGDLYTDVEEKVFDWLEAGTQMVLVINPRKHLVTVYRSLTELTVLAENDTIDGGMVVPGWTMPVRELFA